MIYFTEGNSKDFPYEIFFNLRNSNIDLFKVIYLPLNYSSQFQGINKSNETFQIYHIL